MGRRSTPAARGSRDEPTALRQRWPAPARPRPVVLVGAGGIVNDAHLPAYRAVGIPVAAVLDVDRARAEATAQRWGIPRVLDALAEAASIPDAVYDLATPPDAIAGLLEQLPEGAAVLVQKPMGRDLAEATTVRDVCRRRRLVAAMNFQLRFAPMMLALGDAVRRGLLGTVDEAEVLVNVRTPWHLWPFLRTLERMEIALHSIHYLDLLRHLLGEPFAAMARTVQGRDAPELASSRSSIILDYGPRVRCCLSINHHHRHGPRHQRSELRLEGDRGAAVATIGVNLDYPHGRPDALELALDDGPWTDVPLAGSWFPDAFGGPMSNLQRYVAGEDEALVSSIEDGWRTMRLVEACYRADAAGGVRLDAVGAP